MFASVFTNIYTSASTSSGIQCMYYIQEHFTCMNKDYMQEKEENNTLAFSSSPPLRSISPSQRNLSLPSHRNVSLPSQLHVFSAEFVGHDHTDSGDKIILSPEILLACEQELSSPMVTEA